jgi:hypothetical protein
MTKITYENLLEICEEYESKLKQGYEVDFTEIDDILELYFAQGNSLENADELQIISDKIDNITALLKQAEVKLIQDALLEIKSVENHKKYLEVMSFVKDNN